MQTERGETTLACVDFPGGHGSSRVRPNITPDNKPHYDALARGVLLLPKCDRCGLVGVPTGPCCQGCGSSGRTWHRCSGRGVVHSWVRYHRTFIPEFEALIPYAVITARLDEGPTVFGRWLSDGHDPQIDAPVCGVVERWADGFCGLAFEGAAP
jgi:uncharacterized protein